MAKVKKDNTLVFTEYKVPKAVATLALPSMLGMLINIIYNLADTFFVGQTGDKNQVAAVSVAMPVFLFCLALGNLFGVGGCAFIIWIYFYILQWELIYLSQFLRFAFIRELPRR